MCGIVGGLVAQGSVTESLLEGLRLLEYRGYDSAGIAVIGDGGIAIRRKEGRIERLAAALSDGALAGGRAGIGHTRWATHGPPSDANAHPHTDAKARVAIVHNGVFENYLELRRELNQQGVRFASDTDTEVLAHLVGREMERGTGFAEAVRRSLGRVRGYYAIAALAIQDGEPRLVCARAGPPLMVATTPESAWLASDVLALIPHARDVVVLEDGDVAELSIGRARIVRLDGTAVERAPRRVDWDPETAAKGAFPHYMLKEIHEQPDVLARTAFDRLREEKGDVAFESGGFGDDRLKRIERVSIVACGTALHAGMIARYLIEGLAGVPVDVDYASEFRYREPKIVKETLALAISQSGETADTLAALRLAKELGARTASICNVEGSTLVRESEAVLLTRAGPGDRGREHEGVRGAARRRVPARAAPRARAGDDRARRRARDDRGAAAPAAADGADARRALARRRARDRGAPPPREGDSCSSGGGSTSPSRSRARSRSRSSRTCTPRATRRGR
jgi:glucosamine--fructose-6-phosphate aminotransferase (isomerizing)